MNPNAPDISRAKAWAALAALFAVSAAGRFALGACIEAPIIFSDEWMHLLLARSLALEGGLFWDGTPVNFSTWAYPWLISPLARNLETQEALPGIQALNAIAISATVPIIYGFAREFTSRRRALAAAALTSLLPGLGYSAMLMAENLFVPVVSLSLWLIYRALARANPGRCLAAGLAMGFALHVKPQGYYLPIIYVASQTIASLIALRARKGRADAAPVTLRTLAPHALTLAGWLFGFAARLAELIWVQPTPEPASFPALFGIHHALTQSVVPFRPATFLWIFTVYAGTWIYSTGLLPFFALARQWRAGGRDEPTPRNRVLFLLATISALVFVGMISFHNTTLVAEARAAGRYTLPVLPLMMLVFCVFAPPKAAPLERKYRAWAALTVLFMAGACAAATLESLWWFGYQSPSMSAIFVALFPGRMPIAVPLLFLAILAGGFTALIRSRGRFAWRAAALACVFACMNIGWYAGHKWVADPKRQVHHDIGRRTAELVPPGEGLLVLHDELDELTGFYAGFFNHGRTLTMAESNRPWYAYPVPRDQDGRFSLLRDERHGWLLASDAWRFDREPEERFAGCALYRLDPVAPLILEAPRP